MSFIKKYQSILFVLTFVLTSAIFMAEFVIAVITYPPFSFLSSMTYSEKYSLISSVSTPVYIVALASSLINYSVKKLPATVSLFSLIAAAAAFFGKMAYSTIDFTVCGYVFSAITFVAVPYFFVSVLGGVISTLKKDTVAKITVFIFSGAIVIFISIFELIIVLSKNLLIQEFSLLYLTLPSVITSAIFVCSSICVSRTTLAVKASAFACGLVLPIRALLKTVGNEIVSTYTYFAIPITLFALILSLIFSYIHKKENKNMANNKINGMGFHHIGLKVKDFDKSYDFYVNGLGMTPITAWGEGDRHIQLLDIGNGDKLELFAGGRDELQRENVWQHLALKVDDVDAAYETALKAGAKSKIAPKDVALGTEPTIIKSRLAFVIGFDGEELEFFKEFN